MAASCATFMRKLVIQTSAAGPLCFFSNSAEQLPSEQSKTKGGPLALTPPPGFETKSLHALNRVSSLFEGAAHFASSALPCLGK